MKKYTVGEKTMGTRYDGGRSPLSDSVILTVPEPGGCVLDGSEPFNHAVPDSWSKDVQADYEAILSGHLKDPVSTWCNERLVEWGYTLERIRVMSKNERKVLCNKLVRAAKKTQGQRADKLLHQLLQLPRIPLGELGYVPETQRQARTALHVKLRTWNAGPLKLERPTGSSLHHLMDYDRDHEMPKNLTGWFDKVQTVLVENDWGAAVPEIDGEWRVPFEYICWEFRISGVRVLVFTEADREPNVMWCVYGADGHWVVDDYRYELGCAALPRGIARSGVDAQEFRRVAKMCYDTIRASCIMLDAQVAHHEHVEASPKLAARRAKEGRAPLRDHYVVRLLHNDQRAHHRVRSAGASAGGVTRAPQRGHWRKGTWVHYDDQDSGQVQYANEGGFMVSKTWRRWHFAGDPKNIIHKEYRL